MAYVNFNTYTKQEILLQEILLMDANVKNGMKQKVTGGVLTAIGLLGLVYAAMCQFAEGGDKRFAAGALLFAIIILFIGISQFYKKDPDQY